MAGKTTEAASEKLNQGASVGIGEIGAQGSIEQTAEKDVNLSMFMEDMLTIMVHQDGTEGANDVIIPVVNGINQPIIRGRQQLVKRKYVEALARGRTTSFEQQVQNPAEPANIQMVPTTTLTYPFAVIEDPNPNGRAWLDNILRQA